MDLVQTFKNFTWLRGVLGSPQDLIPWWNAGPLHWELRVLATGLPGKALARAIMDHFTICTKVESS